MKIKNKILADLLSSMGVDAKAELVIDDSNGVALTFPNISDIAEIAEGVAVDAPDGTYVVAHNDGSMTVVVLAGAVVSASMDEPAAAEAAATELEADTQAALAAIVEVVVALKVSYASVVAELKDLKASLKHDVEKPAAAAVAKTNVPQFKVIG